MSAIPTVVPRLFQPLQVGKFYLGHRVVLAPLTRVRANKEHVHGDLAVEYYSQRASIPGTLLITEATYIAAQATGIPHTPGIWNDAQVAAWKRVTDAVHDKGSRIFCQIWALGRAADPDVLKSVDPSFEVVSASNIPLTGSKAKPRPLTIPEIKEYVQLYAIAAANAVRAGFDGVEIHGANGYLIDQFIQDVSNVRTDEYGGSIENRCRFALEVIDSVVSAIGANKVGLRLNPWGLFQDMRMKDPRPTFSYLASKLVEKHPDFAYLHVVEPRVNEGREIPPDESLDFLRDIWGNRPFISAGGHTRETALETAEKYGGLVAFGRHYLANPDLPLRLAKNLPLTEGDRTTYYTPESPKGYIDYPFSDDPNARL